MSKKTRLLQSIDQWRMWRGGGDINKIYLGSQKTKKTIFSHARYLFLFFSRTLNSFTLLDSDQNRSNSINRLSLAADKIYMSGDELGSKFSYVPIWKRGYREGEVKNAKFAFL